MKPQFLTGVSKTPASSSFSTSSSLNSEQKKVQSAIKTLVQEFGKLLLLFLNDGEEMHKLLLALKNSYQTIHSIQKTLKHSDYYRSQLFNITSSSSSTYDGEEKIITSNEDSLTMNLFNKIFQEIEHYFLQLRQFSKRLSDDLMALNLKYMDVVKLFSQESLDAFTDSSSVSSSSYSFASSLSSQTLFIFSTEHLADLCQILKMISLEKIRKISLMDHLLQLNSSSSSIASPSQVESSIPISPSMAVLGVIDFKETEKILDVVIEKWHDVEEVFLDEEQIDSFMERNNIKNL